MKTRTVEEAKADKKLITEFQLALACEYNRIFEFGSDVEINKRALEFKQFIELYSKAPLFDALKERLYKMCDNINSTMSNNTQIVSDIQDAFLAEFSYINETAATSPPTPVDLTYCQSFNCNEEIPSYTPIHPAITSAREDIFRKQVFGEELKKYVKLIPTEMMIIELRNRELSKPLNAVINVNKDGTVGFEIPQLNWPIGKYEVKITFEKEITP